MKRYCAAVLAVILLFFAGCQAEKTNPELAALLPTDIQINNKASLDSLTPNAYSITDLNNFFGVYSTLEKQTLDIRSPLKNYTLEETNRSFPVLALRANNSSCYAVYRVQEGGLFYVFFTAEDKALSVSDTFYMAKTLTPRDFARIIPNKSSYEDVCSIDPASELLPNLPDEMVSYSLLKDRAILKVEYRYEKLERRTDLMVEKMSVLLSTEETGSKLQDILPKDLLPSK